MENLNTLLYKKNGIFRIVMGIDEEDIGKKPKNSRTKSSNKNQISKNSTIGITKSYEENLLLAESKSSSKRSKNSKIARTSTSNYIIIDQTEKTETSSIDTEEM